MRIEENGKILKKNEKNEIDYVDKKKHIPVSCQLILIKVNKNRELTNSEFFPCIKFFSKKASRIEKLETVESFFSAYFCFLIP